MKRRIHLFGASGSGTSSIGKAICRQIGYKHLDSDNYLWLPTEEPFTVMRSSEEYINMMGKDLVENKNWVLCGHVSFGLNNVYLSLYELVVFIYVPTEIRLERLKKREFERYGREILPGGKNYEKTCKFMEYASGYDTVKTLGRNLYKHKEWLKGLKCTVIEIINDSFEESVRKIIESIKN